jgi:serine/threonine protein kinase
MMAGQAAEQIIAGVVLSERLAVTMYGAIHRAQFGGQRNLRGLVVDPRMLEEDTFRIALIDGKTIDRLVQLQHPNIVPILTVESGGPDVVIVTRGVGRYVTVQDLIASAKARARSGGRLAMPVAAAVGKSVIEALAAAHKAGVIHGAVHPRSVLIGEDGVVMLSDFIVGRALTTVVSRGTDSKLWRGLSGYMAPELEAGRDPTPGVDVFAVGALLFAMLTGEVPPGSLKSVTPAVERLVQRALDSEPSRRYKNAAEMLENFLEALEDDRWQVADRGELIKEAGLSATDENIDDATEDLLASLGSSNMQVTQSRKGSEGFGKAPDTQQRRLDAMLADLDDNTNVTHVDDLPAGASHDPVSDIIKKDRQPGRAATPRPHTPARPLTPARPIARVPSLDDPDDDDMTPLPPPSRGTTAADEAAAFEALSELDDRRSKPEIQEHARRVVTSGSERPAPRSVQPIVDPIDVDVPPVKLRSPIKSAIFGLVLLGIVGGAGYMVYTKYQEDKAKEAAAKAERDKQQQDAEALEAKLRDARPDPGALEIVSPGAGIWLRLGRTPVVTPIHLPAGQPHDMVLLRPGHEVSEAQVNGTHWTGASTSLKGKITVTLKPSKAKDAPALPLQPTTAVLGSTGVVGAGPVTIESTPSDAEVWLFIGANQAQFNNLWAGRDYELAVVKPGFKTQHVTFKAEDWRDGGDPNLPIDVAKKKPVLRKTVELEADPSYKPGKKGK